MAPRTDLSHTASTLNSAAIHLLRGLRAVDRESGLTSARLSALSVLVFGGPLPLGRLAEAEDIAGPTMTRIVDGLVRLGLAERSAHPVNGRVVLVSATAEGVRVMHAAAQRRIDRIARGLQTMSPDEQAQIAAAAAGLSRLPDRMRDVPDAYSDARTGSVDSSS